MRFILCTLLLFIPAPSFAQVAPDPTQFLQLALKVTEAIDNGQAALIWDSASQIMKTSTQRAQFVQITEQRRKQQGLIQNRVWEAVVQQSVPQTAQGIPAGRYLSVIIAGTNATGSYVKEQVSFSIDPDNQWRIVGYTIAN